MKWKLPPKIKIYEALGAIGDGRVEHTSHSAKVVSSSGKKVYDVGYDPQLRAIRANDNGSYWKGYLGYPAIAFLMGSGIISYDPKYSEALKNIPWKDINTRFDNDFDRTAEYVHQEIRRRGMAINDFLSEVDRIHDQISKLDLSHHGKRKKPPTGY